MATLDHNYITELASRAQIGDSNAFAELYAATCQSIYAASFRYLKDEKLAQKALKDTYVSALKRILSLNDPELFIAWINQIGFSVRYRLKKAEQSASAGNDGADLVHIDTKEYAVEQILRLPFTESQVLILKYHQKMSNSEIAKLLDISRPSVRRYLNSGRLRLATLSTT